MVVMHEILNTFFCISPKNIYFIEYISIPIFQSSSVVYAKQSQNYNNIQNIYSYPTIHIINHNKNNNKLT